MRRNLPDRTRDRTLELLERAAPWVVVGLLVTLAILGLLAAILGAPWAR